MDLKATHNVDVLARGLWVWNDQTNPISAVSAEQNTTQQGRNSSWPSSLSAYRRT